MEELSEEMAIYPFPGVTRIRSKTIAFVLIIFMMSIFFLSSGVQAAIDEESVDLGPEDSHDINLKNYGTPGEELQIHIELSEDGVDDRIDISIHMGKSDENIFEIDNTSMVEFKWEYPDDDRSYYLVLGNDGDEDLLVLVRLGTPKEFSEEGGSGGQEEIDQGNLIFCGVMIIISAIFMVVFYLMAQKRKRTSTIEIPTLTGEMKTIKEPQEVPKVERPPRPEFGAPPGIVREKEYVQEPEPIYQPIPPDRPYSLQPPPYYPYYPPPPPPPRRESPSYVCPDCERQMVYNAHIGRWFCYSCNKYKNA